jgi:hypothetical protein
MDVMWQRLELKDLSRTKCFQSICIYEPLVAPAFHWHLSSPFRYAERCSHGVVECRHISSNTDHVKALVGEHLGLLAARAEYATLLSCAVRGC